MLSPEGSFTASGFYHPEPAQLAALRRAIATSPEQFQEVERAHSRKRSLSLSREESLKRCLAASRTPRPGRLPRP